MGKNHFDLHDCDMCEIPDGRPTLYWADKDFDLCYKCLLALTVQFIDPGLKITEGVKVKRRLISEEIRNMVFSRDGNKCASCDTPEALEVDHIKPFSRGGNTALSNLQTLCKKCNNSKRDRYAHEMV